MEPVVIAVLVGISVYIAVIALIPPHLLKGSTSYTRSMLQKLENAQPEDVRENELSVLREQTRSSGVVARIFMALPGVNAIYPSLLQAGLGNKIGRFFSYCLIVFVLSLYVLHSLGFMGVIGAIGLSYLFGWRYVRKQITRRNDAFINFFPDALDMIIRSVRSGYPLNSAVRMVADNMQPPVSTEFKQVADEVAYGSTLIEALQRLSLRIDEPDVRFFVVVLTVQQDVGGNLSEVLSNLSSIIRKRKYLRLKIKALSSEGRATAWVLGSMPVVEAMAIQFVAPNHLTPLFTTELGNTVLGVTIFVAVTGILIVKQMVTMKV